VGFALTDRDTILLLSGNRRAKLWGILNGHLVQALTLIRSLNILIEQKVTAGADIQYKAPGIRKKGVTYKKGPSVVSKRLATGQRKTPAQP